MPSLQSSISKLSPLFEYLKKQREIEKNRRIFEVSITFVLISFFLFFAIRPTLLTISALVGDIKAKEILSTKLKDKINQVITAQDNFSSVQERYFLVEEALPANQNFVAAMTQIDDVAQKNNFNLDKISFTQSDKNYFSTQISTSSSFSSSLGLLGDIFQRRRLVDVTRVSFTQNKESEVKGEINFTIPIDIYFWNNKNEKK